MNSKSKFKFFCSNHQNEWKYFFSGKENELKEEKKCEWTILKQPSIQMRFRRDKNPIGIAWNYKLNKLKIHRNKRFESHRNHNRKKQNINFNFFFLFFLSLYLYLSHLCISCRRNKWHIAFWLTVMQNNDQPLKKNHWKKAARKSRSNLKNWLRKSNKIMTRWFVWYVKRKCCLYTFPFYV